MKVAKVKQQLLRHLAAKVTQYQKLREELAAQEAKNRQDWNRQLEVMRSGIEAMVGSLAEVGIDLPLLDGLVGLVKEPIKHKVVRKKAGKKIRRRKVARRPSARKRVVTKKKAVTKKTVGARKGRGKGGINLSAKIRQYDVERPGETAAQVAKALGRFGITAGLVRTVRGQVKAKRKSK